LSISVICRHWGRWQHAFAPYLLKRGGGRIKTTDIYLAAARVGGFATLDAAISHPAADLIPPVSAKRKLKVASAAE